MEAALQHERTRACLALPSAERLLRVVEAVRHGASFAEGGGLRLPHLPFDPLALLQELATQRVAFLVIGGLAGVVHGSPTLTYDLDMCYRCTKANLVRLARALNRVQARPLLAAVGEHHDWNAARLAQHAHFDLTTPVGDFDCPAASPARFRRVAAQSIASDLATGSILVISLAHHIEMKQRADRPNDRAELAILRLLQQEYLQQAGLR